MVKAEYAPCRIWRADCKTQKCLLDFYCIIQSVPYMETFNSGINKSHFSFMFLQNISNKLRIYMTPFFNALF